MIKIILKVCKSINWGKNIQNNVLITCLTYALSDFLNSNAGSQKDWHKGKKSCCKIKPKTKIRNPTKLLKTRD